MKKRWFCLALVMAALLCGCGQTSEGGKPGRKPESAAEGTAAENLSATVPATVPADGNPADVTCKGSYTGTQKDTVVAVCGTEELTNGALQVWYWAEVAQYRQEGHETEPDYSRPLDTQVCEIDGSVNSWQQFFLKRALSAWHRAQALIRHSEQVPMATEEAYQPNLQNIEKYMTGMPAAEVLYGYHTYYQPNSLHQAYLDEIPGMLETLAREKGHENAERMAEAAFGTSVEALETFSDSCNRGYMYFTELTHSIAPAEEELEAFYTEQSSGTSTGERCVDFRQILLVPRDVIQEDNRPSWERQEPTVPVVLETVTVAPDGKVTASEKAWALCEEEARQLLSDWQNKKRGTEATFGETAHQYTMDPGTKVNGGRYQSVRRGQMTEVIDNWCFDPARQAGDTGILRSDYGVHILYFSGSRTLDREAADREYHRQQQNLLITEAKDAFPMEVDYRAISLQEAQAMVSVGDILYPDIAHERFPEVPLYLQQDYPKTYYGGFELTKNGCGITSFAMVASYLTDEELTPPEMAGRYGKYSHANGTDGLLFNIESSVLGFYLREKTYDVRAAKKALEDGYLVVSIQHPGYWTRGGHYIVCECINEEGLVQVRDSNIYNYSRVRAHANDGHEWWNIVEDGSGYWIFDYKVTRIPACSRCGDPQGVTESLLKQDYICEKCAPAMLRRSTYLNG